MTTSTTTPTRPKPAAASLLHDQLSQFDRPPKPPADFMAATRGIFAWILMLGGLGVGGWTIWVVHRAIFHPTTLGLPLKILKAEDLTITVPNGKIEIPPAAGNAIGYLLLVFLLAIVARIATGLITQGAGLTRESKGKDVEGR